MASQKHPVELFNRISAKLPQFRDGRINYSDAKEAPVLNAVVYSNNEILIVKRSDKVSNYPGLWNGISGYIDRAGAIERFVEAELNEEIGLKKNNIKRIAIGEVYRVEDKAIDKTWHVFPVLVEASGRPAIKLDWEHSEYKWIEAQDLGNYNYVKDFDKSVRLALEMLNG